jgi:hypothetical protein
VLQFPAPDLRRSSLASPALPSLRLIFQDGSPLLKLVQSRRDETSPQSG